MTRGNLAENEKVRMNPFLSPARGRGKGMESYGKSIFATAVICPCPNESNAETTAAHFPDSGGVEDT